MTKEKIVKGSKLIATYLNYVYIPFNDLRDFKKPGWYEVIQKTTDKREITITTRTYPDGEITTYKKQVSGNYLLYSVKNGWESVEDYHARFICRTHDGFDFYSSLD